MNKLNIFLKKICGIFLIILTSFFYWTEVRERDWRYVTRTDDELKKYYTNEKLILNLYQLTKDFHEILTKHKVQYWIEAGTLLGAVRNEGIIKFDDDVDVQMMHEDEIKFQDLIPEFEKLGYSIRNESIYSICHEAKAPCLDIFICHRTRDDKVIYTNLSARKKFSNMYFYMNELFPLKKYKFGEIELYGPNNAKPFLDRAYLEWDKYAVIQQKHTDLLYVLGINKVKFLLTPKLMKPAEPIGPLKDRVN